MRSRPYAGIPGQMPPYQPPDSQGETVEELLASIRDLLGEIRDDLAERSPVGNLYWRTVLVSASSGPDSMDFGVGLFSLRVVNLGPNTLQVRIPGGQNADWADIAAIDELPMSLPKGVITSIQYRVQVGTATMRIYGAY